MHATKLCQKVILNGWAWKLVTILAIENDHIILENQYRFPHGNIIEIPSGTIKKDEKAEDCATRENNHEWSLSEERRTVDS